MNDPTARAREVISKFLFLGFECYYDGAPGPQNGDNEAALLLLNLQRADLAIIDTRTHVAIAREPSEEMVERVAEKMWVTEFPTWPEGYGANRETLCKKARAAIAALVQGGGE